MPLDRASLRREAQLACLPLPLAELEERGVTRAQVRGPRWRRTSYGCYVPTGSGLTEDGVRSPLQRILEAVPLLPAHGALTGWSAAYLAGVTALDGRDSQTMRQLPVPVCLGGPVGRGASQCVVYLNDHLAPRDVQTTTLRVVDCSGAQSAVVAVRVTAPVRAAFDGVRQARDLGEAVAFLDACAHSRWIKLSAVSDYVFTRQGARRIAFVRHAVEYADPASRSVWESRLRVFYITVAGLPRPAVNVPIFDLDGRLLGIADLLDEDAGLVTEFDGAQHRDRRQHRADNEREELFEDAGLTVVRADSLDLVEHDQRLVARLRSGHRRGMQRDRGRDRWTVVPPEWWVRRYG